ncbi:MAG TPA: alpha/beta fold hydrolase, partial [Usitatibacter sp.]|nr:alpha/beta fold hydrolase [Usitatibacter sp.]
MSLPAAIFLHGANGCATEMEPLAALLQPYARLIAVNLPGHGGRPVPEKLGIDLAADDVIAVLDREGIDRAFFVGYSLGGYTAARLAQRFPDRTLGFCALATKFVFDIDTVSKWTYLAQADRLAANVRGAQMLKAHGEGWRAVTEANQRLFMELGANPVMGDADFAAITRPALLVNSNRDSLVQWSETLRIGGLIPGAQLVMFHGLAHPMRNVPVHP